ncbi:hypothetical protein ACFS5L_05220 [Streptomyces phyllanthi]|uniref:Uncharacterized protein n=1 Tax=Streptomyces phyllanthi TaxID=1803180 RepID=A0A5N8W009_9ACTN|nr:hypothetical protein [Streptomyces phyllanthi]MPY40286.1 hypothetical protein [Streptomyces phyllanthi]
MQDSARMWITAVPPFGPDDAGVLLAVDVTSGDPGERMVSMLLNRGHEGAEGVFHLLPFDLSARYRRNGDRLAVSVTASREILAHDLADRPDDLGEHLAGLPHDAGDDDRVTLLCREIATDFVPAERDGAKQAVLLIDHVGPASLGELFSRFGEGEASIAVLHAD